MEASFLDRGAMVWQQRLYGFNAPFFAKTGCCGARCQVSGTRVCCEHAGLQPHVYCGTCHSRYQEWQVRNRMFLDLVDAMESQTNASNGTSQGEGDEEESLLSQDTLVVVNYGECGPIGRPHDDSNYVGEDEEVTSEPVMDESTDQLLAFDDGGSQSNEEGMMDEEECPICLERFEGHPCLLVCGHGICYNHLGRLERCPLCRYPIDVTELEMDDGFREIVLAEQRRNKYLNAETDSEYSFNMDLWSAMATLNRPDSEPEDSPVATGVNNPARSRRLRRFRSCMASAVRSFRRRFR